MLVKYDAGRFGSDRGCSNFWGGGVGYKKEEPEGDEGGVTTRGRCLLSANSNEQHRLDSLREEALLQLGAGQIDLSQLPFTPSHIARIEMIQSTCILFPV